MNNQIFDLDMFCAKRDVAQQRFAGFETTASEIVAAYTAGERNFCYADLARANLTDTNLYGANLTRANLDGACGLYSVFAPHLSSRRASLFGGLGIEGGVVQLRFWAGCKMYITAETLRKHVAKTHGDNNYARQYEAAIRFIETCFEIDMAAHKWDYLLNWTSPQQS